MKILNCKSPSPYHLIEIKKIFAIIPIVSWATTLTLLLAFPMRSPGADGVIPLGCWDNIRAEKLEKAFDTFFADADIASRAKYFSSTLEALQPGLSLEELETINKTLLPSGEKKGNFWRLQAPWLKDNPRGWLNVSLPKDYSPKKAYGMIVALHGSSSDGDNLPSFYTPQLNIEGYFVIYPTTTDVNNYWSTPAEVANVYHLIEWMARNYRIDFRRLVISGASMGGMGTWSHLLARPELWSVGASVAGHPSAMQGDILEKLRGIPFYILHGEKDTNGVSLAPVEKVRQAVEELKKRNLNYIYVEEPGAGHTPSIKYWQDMNVWITKQAPKIFSPRALFLPPAGERPLWQRTLDPMALQDDTALSLIKEGKFAEAKKELETRMTKNPGDAKNHMLHAIATLPAIGKPLPEALDKESMKDGTDGWSTTNENSALRDLDVALNAKKGKGDKEKDFDANIHLMTAKIYARRFIMLVGPGSIAWVSPFNKYNKELEMAFKLNPANPEIAHLSHLMVAKVPKK